MASKRDIDLARLKYQDRARIYEHVAGLLNRIVGGATVVLPFYFAYLSLLALAGKETTLRAVVAALVDMKIDQFFSWAVALIATGAAIRERRIKQRAISGMEEHVRKLEERIDPNRSTSGLAKTGEPK